MIGIKAACRPPHRLWQDRGGEFTVSTSGPCTSDITRLPYKKLRRPVFPLDRLEGCDSGPPGRWERRACSLSGRSWAAPAKSRVINAMMFEIRRI